MEKSRTWHREEALIRAVGLQHGSWGRREPRSDAGDVRLSPSLSQTEEPVLAKLNGVFRSNIEHRKRLAL